MLVCKKCGISLDENNMFCSNCGSPVVKEEPQKPIELVCISCGAKLVDEARFCSICGSPVVKEEPQKPVEPVCTNCGAKLAEGAKFCNVCGTSAAKAEPTASVDRFCSKCGDRLAEGVRFCGSCGTDSSAPVSNIRKNIAEVANNYTVAEDATVYTDEDIAANKAMAIIAYIIFLVPLLTVKDSPFVRFHTNQSIVALISEVAGCALGMVLMIISPVLGGALVGLVSLSVSVILIMGLINAANGKAQELPVVGKIRILK